MLLIVRKGKFELPIINVAILMSRIQANQEMWNPFVIKSIYLGD